MRITVPYVLKSFSYL